MRVRERERERDRETETETETEAERQRNRERQRETETEREREREREKEREREMYLTNRSWREASSESGLKPTLKTQISKVLESALQSSGLLTRRVFSLPHPHCGIQPLCVSLCV